MRNVLFWTSLPFLWPQALWVRRTAPRFAGAAGADTGSVAGIAPVRLLAIGDSIVAGVGASTLDLALVGQTATALARALGVGVDWQCLGRIGATSADVSRQLLPTMPAKAADYIVLSVGVNDLTSLRTLGRWQYSLDALLAALGEHSPKAIIAVAGMPPLHGFPLLPQPLRAMMGLRGRSFDAVARRTVARHRNAVHVPIDFVPSPDKFSLDGFHPSESSYVDFGQAVATAIAGRIAQAGPATTDTVQEPRHESALR